MAMGFSEAVQWWEEWQLRVLVLTSVFLQWFLSFAGILRKRCIPSWLRFLIWLAYLGSDAVAIYALATFFNRQKTQEWVTTDLQVLWVPILLIHLGGRDSITAYNIEDNELWRRHVLTAVSQVAVAAYVFWESWPEDKRIMVTGIMLFVVGFFKCILKPWDLKRVSINSMVDSPAGSAGNGNVNSFGLYIRAATEYFQECCGRGGQPSGSGVGLSPPPYYLFLDLSPPYLHRLNLLKGLVHEPADTALHLVRSGLSVTFDRLYTKQSLLVSWIHGLRLVIIGTLVPIGLGISFPDIIQAHVGRTDVKITVILFGTVIALDYLLPPLSSLIRLIEQCDIGKRRWPDQVAQYNLIGYLARNKKHRTLRRLATLLVCKDYIDQLWCMTPSKLSSDITKLVHRYITQAWTQQHIKDMSTYRAFNDNRGQWTLNWEGCGDSLAWSLERPFDESVLLWHLATDFCFHHLKSFRTYAQRCRVMSNYMVYLLFVNPEMLMTGARRFLFREAYRQLKKMLKLKIPLPEPDGAGPLRHESEFAQNIQHASARVNSFGDHFTYVYNAWRLAQHLNQLRMDHGDAKMWRVVQGVLVEMLCFSAGRCRGYLHAKSLGKGGEYLSYIWLLMSYMGMETLAERMQRTEASLVTPSGEENV